MTQYAFISKPNNLIESYLIINEFDEYTELEEPKFSDKQLEDIEINEGIVFNDSNDYIHYLTDNGYLKNENN